MQINNFLIENPNIFSYFLYKTTVNCDNIIALLDSNIEINKIQKELSFFLPSQNIIKIYEWNTDFFALESPGINLQTTKIQNIDNLNLKNSIILCTPRSFLQKNMNKDTIDNYKFDINIQDGVEFNSLLKKLKNNNYQEVVSFLNNGEFLLNNNFIEIFQDQNNYYRILFSTKIEQILKIDFDNNQTLTNNIKKITILPITETLDAAEINFQNNFISKFRTKYNEENCLAKEYYLPLYYEDTSSISEIINEDFLIVNLNSTLENLKNTEEKIEIQNQKYKDDNFLLLATKDLYNMNFRKTIDKYNIINLYSKENAPKDSKSLNINNIPNFYKDSKINKKTSLKLLKDYFEE